MGLIHSGIPSYVSGDGDTIQRMTYQKMYMDAKEVKSYAARLLAF